jgi:hypothetical protein
LALLRGFAWQSRHVRLREQRSVQLSTAEIIDVYNVFSGNTPLVINTTYGPNWLQPTQIMDARLLKLGFQLEF